MVFLTPRDEFWISWRGIWEEGTWDRYSQAPKLHLVISQTNGQYVLTKVAQSAKNDVFMLSVNMMSYIKLPYKYNLISEDDENIEFDATIALNQINISIP